ncbi:YbjQ family protein [Paracoccus sp. CPCC 101403]|uniref:UPF0145 protein RM190_21130 n=1 Tax=Paracoccus broussonetiae TaxID=3075834 RepID=A0ABU3EJE7_9RHOB|nr:YbjQ family protein [Paracoccus sp. CPCC 101403]MDT1064378.1 YbjQ family protein [Paracoccus sp. CPCC 101403]
MIVAVCAACQNEDFTVNPVSQLCRSCEDELGATDYATEAEVSEAVSSILLTTEATSNLRVTKRLGIVSAECVVGLHIFKDLATGLRDVFGGRSKVMQSSLREIKQTALQELQEEAFKLGADAVVAVNLQYSDINGKMLLLVASGTAVKLQH